MASNGSIPGDSGQAYDRVGLQVMGNTGFSSLQLFLFSTSVSFLNEDRFNGLFLA
jgi:hypothetical protein